MQNKKLEDLVELMARLRAPDGCPWDRAQTPESLTPYIVEEAYELVEAIQEGDRDHVREELGDLLFQIVFQAEIGRQEGAFDMVGVIGAIHEKMTRRHPHVFGDAKADTPDEVRKNWARIKEDEGRVERKSVLGKIPRSMPSLLRARRITENAAEVGFDWEKIEDVEHKLEEELAEFREAVKGGREEEIEDEFGDVLFVLVNLSRFLKLDPEEALAKTIAKFERRFHYMENRVKEEGKRLEDMTLSEMDAFWNEAKGKEK